MKLKKGAKITLITLFVLIIGIIVVFLFMNQGKKKEAQEVKVINEISEYGYQLKETQSKVYQELFHDLVDVLREEKVDEEKYAEIISKLFIMDLYTLSNKVAKTDIGGVEFVHSDEKNDFIEKAMDTIYKYVESNVYGERKQDLPTVKQVTVTSIEQTSFEYHNTKDTNAYQVKVTFDYEKDMGYETEATLILVHEDQKLSIVEMD